ncbi:cytochrome P450 [Amycolatopsis nigrescens]|uniref:cytochrome P450 n=1 Tax=Amycolatopsis nigrescens TaxID=381445 RepID=UPI00037C4CE5|nr:cytochrome P450 [Amycolatopsis nigrescens]
MTDTEPIAMPTARTAGCPFDPPAEYQRLPPLSPMRYPDGHAGWLVSEHATSRRVLSDPRFSHRPELRHAPIRDSNPGGRGQPAGPGWFPLMDAPEHTRYRRLLTGWFTVRRMRLLEPRIAEITADHLDAMAETGPPADLVPAFALPIPSLVICELLGVPYRDRAAFQERTALVVDMDRTPDEVADASAALVGYLGDLVRHKRRHPTDDLLGALAAESGLTDDELAVIGVVMLVAGHETTANMIALGVFALLENPGQLTALRYGRTAAERAVDELLRYLTILQFGVHRAALEDVDLDGTMIHKGQTVTVALPAANRDPVTFPEPDVLRLDRDGARHHLAFGHGVHQCLGQQLARSELRIAYSGLFARFPALRLALPAAEIPLLANNMTYGVRRLPVAW